MYCRSKRDFCIYCLFLHCFCRVNCHLSHSGDFTLTVVPPHTHSNLDVVLSPRNLPVGATAAPHAHRPPVHSTRPVPVPSCVRGCGGIGAAVGLSCLEGG